jgi:hypothetical protein
MTIGVVVDAGHQAHHRGDHQQPIREHPPVGGADRSERDGHLFADQLDKAADPLDRARTAATDEM